MEIDSKMMEGSGQTDVTDRGLDTSCSGDTGTLAPHGVVPHGVAPHGVVPHVVAPHGVAPHGVAPHGATPPQNGTPSTVTPQYGVIASHSVTAPNSVTSHGESPPNSVTSHRVTPPHSVTSHGVTSQGATPPNSVTSHGATPPNSVTSHGVTQSHGVVAPGGIPPAVKMRMRGVEGGLPDQRNSWHGSIQDPPSHPGRNQHKLQNQRSFSSNSDGVMIQQQRSDPSLHFSCPTTMPDSPEISPVKYRPVSRNHSLKYSGGALHDTDQPTSFDHNFNSPARDQKVTVGGVKQPPRRSLTPGKETRGSTPSPSQRKLARQSETVLSSPPRQSETVLSPPSDDGGGRRSRSSRLPPLVRVLTEDAGEQGPRLPRTRGSYSLSRSERGGKGDVDRTVGGVNGDLPTSPLAGASDSVSMYSHSSTSSLQPASSVAKSVSMTNMSGSGSDPGDWLSSSHNSVTVTEARKRSYLVGSVGPTSLLGTAELEKQFPDRTIRIFVGTWNMNGQVPPRHLAEFLLPANLKYVPDLLVVGTQETFPEKTEWEVRLQDTLGPSHVLFHSASLGTLHLTVFLRRDLIWYCSVPEDDGFSTRPGAQFKTKGAVAVAFLLFGTSFMFVNSHLTAHQENVRDRVKDLKKIYAMLNLPKSLPLKRRGDLFDSYDCVFWCGDLNFRLEQSRAEIIRDIEEGVSVLETDQLAWLMSRGTIFKGFKEFPITFRPTYKYDPGTDKFDTSSKQRIPSYTDRILYKHSSSTPVKPLHYDSVQGVVTSDHKPVWGMYEVKIRPGKDSIPLAGGLFNRPVYLEGLKRRSEALKPILGKGSGNICSIS